MRLSLLLALAFFCALIDHAQAANDHQKVAQATSRTGGYDLYPGGGSPGGLAIPGDLYVPSTPARRYPPNVGGAFPGGTYSGGEFPGGMYPGGTYPGGAYSGGEFPTGGPSVRPGGIPRDVSR
jgi:hypothetical protein